MHKTHLGCGSAVQVTALCITMTRLTTSNFEVRHVDATYNVLCMLFLLLVAKLLCFA